LAPADDPHAEHRHVFAISAERALCRDVEVNVAYPWLCALSIEDTIPDHSA
jgi:transposase